MGLDSIIDADFILKKVDEEMAYDPDQAKAILARAIMRCPGEPRLLVSMGDILFNHDYDLDNAEYFYEKAYRIRQDPKTCSLTAGLNL